MRSGRSNARVEQRARLVGALHQRVRLLDLGALRAGRVCRRTGAGVAEARNGLVNQVGCVASGGRLEDSRNAV